MRHSYVSMLDERRSVRGPSIGTPPGRGLPVRYFCAANSRGPLRASCRQMWNSKALCNLHGACPARAACKREGLHRLASLVKSLEVATMSACADWLPLLAHPFGEPLASREEQQATRNGRSCFYTADLAKQDAGVQRATARLRQCYLSGDNSQKLSYRLAGSGRSSGFSVANRRRSSRLVGPGRTAGQVSGDKIYPVPSWPKSTRILLRPDTYSLLRLRG